MFQEARECLRKSPDGQGIPGYPRSPALSVQHDACIPSTAAWGLHGHPRLPRDLPSRLLKKMNV